MGLHFSKQEFLQRKTKVLQSMKEQNLDAILMFRQESMYWVMILLVMFSFKH